MAQPLLRPSLFTRRWVIHSKKGYVWLTLVLERIVTLFANNYTTFRLLARKRQWRLPSFVSKDRLHLVTYFPARSLRAARLLGFCAAASVPPSCCLNKTRLTRYYLVDLFVLSWTNTLAYSSLYMTKGLRETAGETALVSGTAAPSVWAWALSPQLGQERSTTSHYSDR